MKKTSLLIAAACTVTFAGCATAPLSFLDGQPRTATDIQLYPVRVVSVDGNIEFRNPVQVAPGRRLLVLEAAGSNSARGTTQQAFVMGIEPCTRYFLAARRMSPMDANWQIVIDAKETVPGCDAADEIKKSEPRATSLLTPSRLGAERDS